MEKTIVSDEVVALSKNIHDLHKVALNRKTKEIMATEPTHYMGNASSLNTFYAWRSVLRYKVNQGARIQIHLPWEQDEVPTLLKLNKEWMNGVDNNNSASTALTDIIGTPVQSEIRLNLRKSELGFVSDTEYHGRTMISYQMLSLTALPAAYLLSGGIVGMETKHPPGTVVPLGDLAPHVQLAKLFGAFDGELPAFYSNIQRMSGKALSLKSTYNRIESYRKAGYDTDARSTLMMAAACLPVSIAREHDFAAHIEDWYEAGSFPLGVYMWLVSPIFQEYPEIIVNWIREGLTAESAETWFNRGIDNSKEAGLMNRSTPNSWANAWD